jgi:TorA maturation chaperone TorD
MSAITAHPDVETRVRAGVYSFLSSSTRYPREPIEAGLLDFVRFDDERLEAGRLEIVEASASASDLASLQAAHRVLFPAVESQDAPSYETAYSERDVFRQSHVMADVAGFYRAHGVNVGGITRDRPDGIGPELEFMGFLAAKEAHASEAGAPEMAELCVETQRSFLTDHLGTWGPEYGRRMATVSSHMFYNALGSLIAAFLDADIGRLGVTPISIEDRDEESDPSGVPVPDPSLGWDDTSCGGVM